MVYMYIYFKKNKIKIKAITREKNKNFMYLVQRGVNVAYTLHWPVEGDFY